MNLKMNKVTKTLLCSTILFLIIISNVNAIGIAPSRVTIDFEPGKEQVVDFCVLNNDRKDFGYEMYVKGDLAEYVTITKEHDTMKAQDTMKCYTYTYKLPSALDPGHHDTRIGALESEAVSIGGMGVAAKAGVESQFWVQVPYPDQWVSITLGIEDASVGEEVPFTVTLRNHGSKDSSVKTSVEFFKGGDSLAILNLGSVTLNPQDEKIVSGVWAGTTKAGIYKAVAVSTWGSDTSREEKDFRVGDVLIEIMNVTPRVNKGGIQEIIVTAQSFWNDPINNVYGTIDMRGPAGNVIRSGIRTESVGFGAWQTKTLRGYWDTTGLEPGIYSADVTVYYGGKTTTGVYPVNVVEAAAGIPMLLIITIIIVIVIIILIAGIAYSLKDRGKPKKSKPKQKQAQPRRAPQARATGVPA